MSADIKFLRLRALLGIVVILLISPFAVIWNAAPYVWDDIRDAWDFHISGSLIVAWAIVMHGKNAKGYVK